TKRTTCCLTGLDNRDRKCARRISRRVFVGFDPETVCLAPGYEFGCRQCLCRRDVVEVSDLIVRTKLRGRQTGLLLGVGADVDDKQQSRAHAKLCRKLHFTVSPVVCHAWIGSEPPRGSGWVHAQRASAIERIDFVPTRYREVVLTRSKHGAS